MRIDCLSVSKHLDPVKPGDDVPVIIPGRCYAVLDGATDVSGNDIGGLGGGRFAALTAAAALTEMMTRPAGSFDGDALVAALNSRLGAELAAWSERLGRKVGAATTLAMMEVVGDRCRFVLVGDSGVRINGHEIIQSLKPVDDLMAAGRVMLHRLLVARGVGGQDLETLSRRGVFHGFDAAVPDLISADEAARLIAAARDALAATGFGTELLALVEPMLRAGIAKGQYAYANRTDHVLGYASIDGTRSRGYGYHVFERPAAEVHAVEIFSDGYLDQPASGAVDRDAWEAVAARIEAEDPGKVLTHWGVKGSNARQLFDDRTVLILTGI
jgi:hypothetical protein